MLTKFKRKELERLSFTEDEIDLIMKYQRKLPILANNDGIDGFCVNVEDLWERLEIKNRFDKWIKGRIKSYKFHKNTDFITIVQKCPIGTTTGFKEVLEYQVTIDMAKQLAMIEKTDIGLLARRYFILMEKAVKRNADWWTIRNPQREHYKPLCEALSENIRRNCGRFGDDYDFAREANILNVIATGSKAQSIRNYIGVEVNELTRDRLEKEINQKIDFLQRQDIICLGMNMPIVERIKFLISAFDITYPDAQPIKSYLNRADLEGARR